MQSKETKMKLKNKFIQSITLTTLLIALTLPVTANNNSLPDPDGKPAELRAVMMPIT